MGYEIGDVDSTPGMLMRRAITSYAPDVPDPYVWGYERITEIFAAGGRALTEADVVADIGCNSGRVTVETARQAGFRPRQVGIDPDKTSHDLYMPKSLEEESGFRFIPGRAENLPFPDNSFVATTLHRVIYRLPPELRPGALREAQRVTEPEGLIVFSTNAKDHAEKRHRVMRQATRDIFFRGWPPLLKLSTLGERPKPPAKGCHVRDVLKIAQAVGGLEPILIFEPEGDAEITRGHREGVFRDAIKLSANRTGIPGGLLHEWRGHVDRRVDKLFGNKSYFTEKVHLGLVILRNTKTK